MDGVALLCDVRGSRDLDDREEFGRHLQVTARRLTESHRSALLTRFETQAGIDEFGAVLEPGRVGDILTALWERLQSVPVRTALAAGRIDVLMQGEEDEGLPAFSNADGPALHRAARLLDELRTSGSLFAIRGPSEEGRTDSLLSSLAEMTYLHVLSWTERQAEVFFAYRRSGVQTEVARELGIQQSTVSHTLSKLEYRPTLEALEVLAEELDARTAEAPG